MSATIEVKGASEHNLKNLDVAIDRGAITIVTGVSGSGKSSLAFDTILAEARRRFFYTLSHYSRQFLDLGSRPAVRRLTGLSPAIALAQNETQPSRRATVGTLSDVAELLGVLFARFGARFCPEHGLPTEKLEADEIARRIMAERLGQTLVLCAPVATEKKGIFRAQFTAFAEKGYLRAFVDGEVVPLTPVPELAREEKHTIKLIIDVLKIKEGEKGQGRLVRSIETAIAEGGGFGEFYRADDSGAPILEDGGSFSAAGGCPVCGFSWPKLDSRHFSANSLGRCQSCDGFGTQEGREEEGGEETSEDALMAPCARCEGTGLEPRYDAVTISGKSARSLHGLGLEDLARFLEGELEGPGGKNPAFRRVAEEALGNVRRIIGVGLGYLALSRRIRTLSGGESQRLKLAGILGENLRGVLYVLDEPSQGLHPGELDQLWEALERLKRGGNTVLIVDHDESLMRRADWIVDLGPGGGARGGRLMGKFRPADAARFVSTSATARSLVREERDLAELPERDVPSESLTLRGATLHNLRVDEVKFPIGAVTAVTGVSGAGKSSLVLGTLYANLSKILEKRRARSRAPKLAHLSELLGHEAIEQISLVDRRPISKSTVSMPASYLDVLGPLRDLFASLPEAQVAGLTARSFSVTADGGRCPECRGRGEIALSMRFLADARVRCPVCQGQRFRPHVLDVRYLGMSIAEVLDLSLDEALEKFANHRQIVQRLTPAVELGLGYLRLGQPSASLSGGEAQRLKLAPHLARRHGKGTLLILDEPTTGLHAEDVKRLIHVLRRLSDLGTTVILLEHHRDVILEADWLIDLGPGPAARGGRVVYQGTPRGLLGNAQSVTARYLRKPPLEEASLADR